MNELSGEIPSTYIKNSELAHEMAKAEKGDRESIQIAHVLNLGEEALEKLGIAADTKAETKKESYQRAMRLADELIAEALLNGKQTYSIKDGPELNDLVAALTYRLEKYDPSQDRFVPRRSEINFLYDSKHEMIVIQYSPTSPTL